MSTAAERWAPPGGRVIWSSKPDPAFILLRRGGVLILLVAAGIAAAWIGGTWGARAAAVALGAAALLLIWSALVWACQTYALTDTHAVWASGVLRRLIVQTPLERVQNVAIYRSVPERLLGLGTVGLATAGTDSFELVWAMVPRPHDRVREVNEAVRAARERAAAAATTPPRDDGPPPPQVPVIGLVGAIGAGKSEVARILARLGCLVVDSDEQARAVLQRPEVRDTLVAWWGGEILDEHGGVDRRKVAAIVFADAQQRRRLEELVHPLIREARAAIVRRERDRAARREPHARAIIVDAPLLYEAGVDRECDAVIFVDAPRTVRLARVMTARGWDEAELARREAAQMPPEEKRRRADHVIPNAGSLEDLAAATGAVLERIEASLAGRDAGRPGVPQAASGGG